MKPSNLLSQDFKIVENRKKFFLVPVIVVVIALIAGMFYGIFTGSPFNFGMDFTGGYTINVKLSTKLTTDKGSDYNFYLGEIETVFENLSNDNGEKYGIKVGQHQLQGTVGTESASIFVRYKSIKEKKGVDTEKLMDEINTKLEDELNKLFKITPTNITRAENDINIFYNQSVSADITSLENKIHSFAKDNEFTASNIKLSKDESGNENRVLSFNSSIILTDEVMNNLKQAIAMDDLFAGSAVKGDLISATVSSELIINTFLAIALAITLMLIYIAFRFEVSSGIAAIIALIHDLLIMFAFVVIFHLEIGSTFIAALITILGYSINNTIVIFDRIRENINSQSGKVLDPAKLANTSVKETILRSINTTITTLITITLVAIIGVAAIRTFALPIIIGLLAGTFSSIFISPSIWAMWKMHLIKKGKDPFAEKKVKTKKEASKAE